LQDEQGFQDELQPFPVPQLSTPWRGEAERRRLNPQPTTLNNLATNAGNFTKPSDPPAGHARRLPFDSMFSVRRSPVYLARRAGIGFPALRQKSSAVEKPDPVSGDNR
jgi:hypothetical protein